MLSITTYPTHGANPGYLYKILETPIQKKVIDFSVNVNPFEPPYDLSTLTPYLHDWLTDYPDPELQEVKEAITAYEQIEKNQLFIGNGASQCIFLLAQYFQKKTVGVIQPTFVEYKEAANLYGCTIKELKVTVENDWAFGHEEILQFLKEIDVLFLCNPNNPTGTVINQESMNLLIQMAKEANTYLIIDEAFYDFSSIPCTVVSEVQSNDHLIILRSLTKMYKLAGIRMGYVIASPVIIKELNTYSPPWSVNRFAAELSKLVLANDTYAFDSMQRIQFERERVLGELKKLGFYVSPSLVNFYLLSDSFCETKMEKLMKYLLEKGIVPRHTYNFIGLEGKYIRLAVRDRNANDELLSALKGWKESC